MVRYFKSILIALFVFVLIIPISAQNQSAIKPIQSKATTLNTLSSGTCLNTTDCVTINLGGYAGIAVQVTGTCTTCVLSFEGTIDGTNWVPVLMTKTDEIGTATVTNTASTGLFMGSLVSTAFRARLGARQSGSFVVTLFATSSVPSLR